ncbi:MAG: VanW family protein [Acidimicrobiia bacterium]|nr:VanW family protein [Acidimicrobiia bacterium]
MPRILRIAIIAALTPVVLALLVTSVFAIDRATDGGEILGSVRVVDVDLGGLTEEEARAELAELEYRLALDPIPVVIEGEEIELHPWEVGFSIDEEALLAQAMAFGRDGGLMDQIRWWYSNLGGGPETVLDVGGTWDPTYLEYFMDRWELQTIDDPPFEGNVDVVGTTPAPVYPRQGTGIDREATRELVEASLFDLDRPAVVVPTTVRRPLLTREDVDSAVEDAERLLAGPVELTRIVPEVRVEIPVEVLAESLDAEIVGAPANPSIRLYFQLTPLLEYIDPLRADLESDPVDARIVIRPDETPTIIPGRNALLIDDAQLDDAVMAAARSVTRSGFFPFRDGDEPEVTTADAEALGIRELLYRARTFYSNCCDEKTRNRVHNIKLIAEAVDGHIVMPGETFSLNEHVGRRTEEKGYRAAGAIIGNEVYCCDHPENIGGGVSQFTTTLYNAVFFSGLEDIEHTPHTLYFPRYPEAREATLGFPSPDLVFRNNTENAVLIDTEADDSSVTVRFYGDNGGIDVEAGLSSRRDFTEPQEVFEPDESIDPGDQEVVDEGDQGWTVTVFRTITYPDGEETVESWVWRYRPFNKVIAVHPCELPEEHEEYDPAIQCPVAVPNILNLSVADARAALTAVGLSLEQGEPVPTDQDDLVGTVFSQSPDPGAFQDLDEPVVVRVRVAAGG